MSVPVELDIMIHSSGWILTCLTWFSCRLGRMHVTVAPGCVPEQPNVLEATQKLPPVGAFVCSQKSADEMS